MERPNVQALFREGDITGSFYAPRTISGKGARFSCLRS